MHCLTEMSRMPKNKLLVFRKRKKEEEYLRKKTLNFFLTFGHEKTALDRVLTRILVQKKPR